MMKNDESSNARAPHPITPACFKIAGMAMLPMAEAPVKNLVAFTHLCIHKFKGNIASLLTQYKQVK